MRIIAITNQKGGVGKTTTTVNLAAALAQINKKVIVLDLDPQAHLTTYFGINPNELAQSSYDVLTQSTPLAQALLQVRENVQILPASMDLAAAEQELVAVLGRETILRDAIAAHHLDHVEYDSARNSPANGEFALKSQADYLFIDCPPSLGLLTLNALSAAHEVFIPLQPHFLSLQGLSQLLESILLVHKRINHHLQVTGLMFCMYDSRTTLSTEIVRDIEEFFTQDQTDDCPWRQLRIFQTRIRGNIKLAESPSYGRTIFEYAPNCHGAQDYLALAEEVEAMHNVSDPQTTESLEQINTSASPEKNHNPANSAPEPMPVNDKNDIHTDEQI